MDQGRQKDEEDCTAALLRSEAWKEEEWHQHACCDLWRRRVCEESRKLWEIVGPAIFTRTATYSLNVIMQAFAGHLGDLELASVSFACTVLTGFNYGLMVSYSFKFPFSSSLLLSFNLLPWLENTTRCGSFKVLLLLIFADADVDIDMRKWMSKIY